MPANVKSLLEILTTTTEPLRQLGHRDTEWKWLEIHDNVV